MPFMNQLSCLAILLMVISFGIRRYIFKILDRLINGEIVPVIQAKYALYFMIQVMLSVTLASFCGFELLLEGVQSLLTHHELTISALSLTQSSVIIIFGVLNVFLVMKPLKDKIAKLLEKN